MRKFLMVTAVVGALAIGACGGGDDGDDGATDTAQTELSTEAPAASPEDALRAAATQHYADYKAMDTEALFEIQSDRCKEVNTLQDWEDSFSAVNTEELAGLTFTIDEVTVDGDAGTVAITVTDADGNAVDTGPAGNEQPWVLVDGEWRQDDC